MNSTEMTSMLDIDDDMPMLEDAQNLAEHQARNLPSVYLGRNDDALPVAAPDQAFQRYINSIQQAPMLSAQEEQALLHRWHTEQHMASAKKLIFSHLRLVYKIARQYQAYGLNSADLMQEGSVGLMMAIKKFNPNFQVRLATYATYWIKAYIHEYILQHWRLVKVASTAAQKKLFFKLRSLLPAQHHASENQLDAIAKQLKVSLQDVKEMQQRLYAQDVALDDLVHDGQTWHESLEDTQAIAPMDALLQLEDQRTQQQTLPLLLEDLRKEKPRIHHIIEKRWIQEPKSSMRELAQDFNVSIERVNQLEKQGMAWLKQKLQVSD